MRLPYQANPYYARTTVIRGPRSARPIALAGFLGDDEADSGEVVLDDSIDTSAPAVSAPAAQDDMFNATVAQESGASTPSAIQSLFASASGTPAPAVNPTQALFSDADAATAAQDASVMPGGGAPGAPPAPAPAPAAAPNASAGSTDWSKAISAALTAGGAATAAVITGRSNKDAAAMARQPGASSNPIAALTNAKGNLTSALAKAFGKSSSWLPWALGGGTIVLIGLLVIKHHAKKPPP